MHSVLGAGGRAGNELKHAGLLANFSSSSGRSTSPRQARMAGSAASAAASPASIILLPLPKPSQDMLLTSGKITVSEYLRQDPSLWLIIIWKERLITSNML